MNPRRRAEGVWLWLLGAVTLFTVVAVMVIFVPLALVPSEGLSVNQRVTAENNLRTTLVQFAGGSILLFGTALTLYINREGQITERFTRAIDQLGQTGKGNLDVRLGGIYALERIARESSRDRGPIVEVLTAFLREHARWKPDDAGTPDVTGRGEAGSGHEQQTRLRADFQAAATVLARNGWCRGQPFDLRGVDLRAVNLFQAQLQRANFFGAHLEEAIFIGAQLEGAMFFDAHLEEANFTDAQLEGANLGATHLETGDLTRAQLEEADLFGAHLEEADLKYANLKRADLTGAHLDGANLSGAELEEAELNGAHLGRAVLYRARLKKADLSYADLEDADLSSAHLEEADFTGAQLVGTDFTDAHLDGTIGLDTANLEGVIGLDAAWKTSTRPASDESPAGGETPAESDDEVD